MLGRFLARQVALGLGHPGNGVDHIARSLEIRHHPGDVIPVRAVACLLEELRDLGLTGCCGPEALVGLDSPNPAFLNTAALLKFRDTRSGIIDIDHLDRPGGSTPGR